MTNLRQLEHLRVVSCEKLCHTCAHWLPHLAQMPRLRALGVGVRDKGIKAGTFSGSKQFCVLPARF